MTVGLPGNQSADEGALGLDEQVLQSPEEARRSRRAFFGSVALVAVNVGRLLLQILVLPVLARLLGPETFGVVSLAMPFVLFANLMADAGLGAALVRVAQPSRELESTVFWLSLAVGCSLALLVIFAAPGIAGLLRQPPVAPVLIALGPVLIVSSSLSVANARISRARHFGLFAVGDLLSISLSSALAIATATFGLGAWSLVIQQLSLWVAKAGWVLSAARFTPTLAFRPRLLGDLLAFGLNNVGANIADFLGKSAPAIAIGAWLGVAAAGKYAMAFQLIRAPELLLSGPLFLVTFASVAGLSGAPARQAQLSVRTLRIAATALAPLFAGLALVADLIIDLFLGPRWRGDGVVLALLAPAGFLLCIYSVGGAVLMGLGRADLQLRLSLAGGVAMLTGVAVGARIGLDAAAGGLAAGALAVLPLYLAVIAGQIGLRRLSALAGLPGPAAALAAMTGCVLLVRWRLAHAGPWPELLAAVAGGAAAFAAVLAATCGRRLLQDLREALPGAVRA